MDLRKRGARTVGQRRNTATGPLQPLQSGGIGETRISADQMAALHGLFQTSSSMQAARQILLGQLLSSGVVIRRQGKDVELTEQFAKHLESVWLPFARDIIDSFLQYGFAAVSIEEELPPPFGGLTTGEREAKRPRKLPAQTGPGLYSKVGTASPATNLVPVVCEPGTYELSFVMGGRAGYRREYRVASLSSSNSYTIDPDVGLFFRTQPDANGNINSPVATCFDSASFVAALQELALNAEVTRARTQLITQTVPRQNGASSALEPAALFFDSESRALQSADTQTQATEQAQALGLVTSMMEEINRLRTTHAPEGSASRPANSHLPPEVPPRLFTIPDRQQLVPNPRAPEARTDLESLLRFTNDAVCAAMGVPASIVFEGKFSSNSMSQLQLLNTTVSSIAINVNAALTACYHACYGAIPGHGEEDEMMLVTAALASTTEIEALFNSKIIDFESALPAALHSLGASANEITDALRRRRDLEEEEKAKRENEAAQIDLASKQAEAQIKATEATAAKTNAEAKAINSAPTAGASAGASSAAPASD